ncbi:porin family protein [Bradyrhizobium sp. CCGUVB4N]|uniref:outer membrane protein n=1 Tax=Bradyrhizobium sp. CCGUVB4N TaxID=2949631 RepID=UPI0020B364FB|nr:outer membrane beta-barrel protein [Bradyrhizobium sp. CCGUVB4N]MCP3380992.1 porin family protein [Bradyrhizobium sp. CCGUVB4N]
MRAWVPVAVATIVITGSANAADLAPVYKAPPAAPVAYSWSGFYLGGNVGVIWNDRRADPVSFTTTGVDFPGRQAVGQFPSFDVRDTAFTGGVQAGYNFQFGSNWVAGLEADINYSGLNKTDTRVYPATPFIGGGIIDPNTESATQKLGWLGTVRGRLGFTTLNNRLLAFATGGLAYGKVDDSIYTIGVPNGAGPVQISASSSSVRVGWTAGGGLEYAFASNWRAKVEYLYYDLGRQNLTLDYAPIPGDANNTITYRFRNNGNLVRVGLNYNF